MLRNVRSFIIGGIVVTVFLVLLLLLGDVFDIVFISAQIAFNLVGQYLIAVLVVGFAFVLASTLRNLLPPDQATHFLVIAVVAGFLLIWILLAILWGSLTASLFG